LGWETSEADWDMAIERALSAKNGVWIVQERIPIRREVFPYIADVGRVDYRTCWWISPRPFPRKARWLSYQTQRHRPRQRDQRRRPSAGLSRLPAKLDGQ